MRAKAPKRMLSSGMTWHDMTWHGMTWHDMAWHGMVGKEGPGGPDIGVLSLGAKSDSGWGNLHWYSLVSG